jgi:hypothetical protein
MSATYIETADKGAASGIAALDSEGRVPPDQLPVAITSVVTLVAGDAATLNPGYEMVNAASGVVGTVYMTPVELRASLNISEIGCYVNSGVPGASLRIALYTNRGNGNGKNYTREAIFGTVPTDTTGAKAIQGTWTLPAGIIWLAWLHLGAAATLRGSAGSLLAVTGPLPADTSPYVDNRILTGPTGQSEFPESFSSTGVGSLLFPVRFGVKVA